MEDLDRYWLDKGVEQVAMARRREHDIDDQPDVTGWPDPWVAAELLTYDHGTEWELGATQVIESPHALAFTPVGDATEALRRAATFDGDDRIAALEDAWRACFDPELADAIEAFDSVRDAPAMPKAKKKKDTETLWVEAAEAAPPRSVFGGDWPKQWRDAQRRMRPLYRRPRSPLFAAAALELSRRDPKPYTSLASQVFWRAHAWFIAAQGDVRQLTAIEELEASINQFTGGQRTVASDALRRLVPRPLSADQRALLGKLSVPAKASTRATLSLASPEERGVAADQLLLAGDPRGELITVQQAIADGGATPALLATQAKLIKKHAKTWVPNTVYRDTCVFHRGVPVAGHLMFRSDPELASMAGSKALATFATLIIDRTYLMGEVSPATISTVVASLPSLRFVVTTADGAIGIARGKPTTVERISIDLARPFLLDGPGLPRLRRVDVDRILPKWIEKPWVTRLEAIGCETAKDWNTWRGKSLKPALVLTDRGLFLHAQREASDTPWELWAEGPVVTARHQVGSTAASLLATVQHLRRGDTLRVPSNFADGVAAFAAKRQIVVEPVEPVEPAREGMSRELA